MWSLDVVTFCRTAKPLLRVLDPFECMTNSFYRGYGWSVDTYVDRGGTPSRGRLFLYLG